jgi:hypothetical protein
MPMARFRVITVFRIPFAVNSWIVVRVSNANLATLIKAPGVLDAAAFALILCSAEAFLVGMKGPGEQEYGGTDKHGGDN